MSEQRDELARDIFVADNWRASAPIAIEDWDALAQSTQAGQTYCHQIADRLIAAGYRKPRTITTIEELEALPSGSVVLDTNGEPNVFHDNGWVLPGGDGGYTSWSVAQCLPATVLYEPTP